MEDIYALLNINTSLIQNFPLKANNLVDHQTELAISRDVRSLKEIEVRMMSDKSVSVSLQSIDEVIQKVIDNAKEDNKDMSIWSIRELRIVSYYLMKLQGNEDAYVYALMLLEKNWRDLFFNGLSFYCLDSWNMIDPQLRTYTCELLRNKLSTYQDGNKKYMVMKNHTNLFDDAGPLRMSAMISQKKLNLMDAPSLFSNNPSTIHQSYYSDVIVNYCNTNYIMDLDMIESVFEAHNQERTKKLVLADLVDRLNKNGDELKRTQLCKFANRMLGDVTLGTTWAPFFGATDKDAQKLRHAKDMVNLWFNQRIIETFFEVCVQDRFRKDFWLRYVDKLSFFRIVGSTAIKRLLQSDSRIGSMFLKYFIETDSSTSQTSALVLFIKNKMLVEFSDTGALYVYNKGHRMVQTVLDRKQSISNTNDLKIPSMSSLISISDWGSCYYYEEGRMTHQGDWQSRLKGWIQQMVLSSDAPDISTFDSEDDELFKAKSVPKEEFKPSSKHCEPEMRDLFSDYLDSGQQIKEQPMLSKTKVEAQSQSLILNKLKSVVYEENVRYSIASKWIFNDKCRVVSGQKGFYLNIDYGRQFVQICDPTNVSISGNIWVKRPNFKGWQEIVHAFCGSENTIGFIKEAGGGILYKRELNQPDFMNIKLR